MTETLKTRKKWFAAAITFASLGLLFSSYLTYHYYDVRGGTASFNSICNINSTMNCDVVAASPYAEFVAGIPLSSFSAGWYLMLIVLGLFMFSSDHRRDAIRLGFGMSAIGALLSLFYLWVMATVLKTGCLFCLAVDGVNFILLGLYFAMKPEPLKKHPFNMGHVKMYAGFFAASIFLGVILLKGLEPEGALDARTIQEFVLRYNNTNPTPVPKDSTGLSIGNADAPITLVEFSDYQCPHCRMAAKIIKSVMDRYPGKIHLIVRSYPLDNACNAKVTRPMHTTACEAARAAICAEKLGKFEPLYEMFFEKQAELAPGKPVEFAKSLGMNEDTIRTCMGQDETQKLVQKNIELADTLGVSSTPTFFLNDRRVEGALPLPVWAAMIDPLLAQQK